ncbi:beta-1-3-galactosyltransferase 5-like [Drosophila madeirensis]|uniref:Hexosyltransferase n=1 Tax=Drosophila madeirensis TaxID=30013 RepID=A0AAU9FG23_DROMD
MGDLWTSRVFRFFMALLIIILLLKIFGYYYPTRVREKFMELQRQTNSLNDTDLRDQKIQIQLMDSGNPAKGLRLMDKIRKALEAPKNKTFHQQFNKNHISNVIPTKLMYEPGHMLDEIDEDRICPDKGKDIKVLFLTNSALGNAEARMAIRQTWGHYASRIDIAHAFVLGRGTNETLNKAIDEENYLYGDLIRGNFIDSYKNITLKVISLLEWAARHCSRAAYIFKTDDDVFINVPKLLEFLSTHSAKRTMYGLLAQNFKPIRNKLAKYYVTTDEYAEDVYPTFILGPAYLFTGDILHELYEHSLNRPYLWLEDIVVTGVVPESLGIKRENSYCFVNLVTTYNPCVLHDHVSFHSIKPIQQYDIWNTIQNKTTKC